MNHLPASAFVAGRQIITNAHDGHVFVDKVGEVEIRLQGGCTVDGETGNQHRDQNDADLLLLLHPDDLFRQRRETQRWTGFTGCFLGEDHVERTDEHGRGNEGRDHTQRQSVAQDRQGRERRNDVGHEGRHRGDHGEGKRHREVAARTQP